MLLQLVSHRETWAAIDLVFEEGYYRVWSTLLEQTVRERKLWNYVLETGVSSRVPRLRLPEVGAFATNSISRIFTVSAKAKATQEQVDAHEKYIDDFAVLVARAHALHQNGTLLESEARASQPLLYTRYLPKAKVKLFSMQKLRKALHGTEQGDGLGTQWVRDPRGEFFMNLKEDREGSAMIGCYTLVP